MRGGGNDGKDKGAATTAPNAIAAAAPTMWVREEWDGGGDLHCRGFDRGVSILHPFIGS